MAGLLGGSASGYAFLPPKKSLTLPTPAVPVVGPQEVVNAGGTYHSGAQNLTQDERIAGLDGGPDTYSLPLGPAVKAAPDRSGESQMLADALAGLRSSMASFGPAVSTPVPAQANRAFGPTADEEKLARDSVFARGKETAGQVGQSAMTGLTEELARRGLTGGGYEAGAIGQTLAQAADSTGEVSRAQAGSEAANKTHIADTQYAGDITQRGQTIGANNAHDQLAVEQSRLALQQRMQSLQGLLSVLSATRATQSY